MMGIMNMILNLGLLLQSGVCYLFCHWLIIFELNLIHEMTILVE
jgi:hypothetical protein